MCRKANQIRCVVLFWRFGLCVISAVDKFSQQQQQPKKKPAKLPFYVVGKKSALAFPLRLDKNAICKWKYMAYSRETQFFDCYWLTFVWYDLKLKLNMIVTDNHTDGAHYGFDLLAEQKEKNNTQKPIKKHQKLTLIFFKSAK